MSENDGQAPEGLEKPSAPWQMGGYHEQKVLEALEEGAKTRKEVMRKTGIARTTVWDALARLQEKGLVKTIEGEPRKKGGRKPAYFMIM